MALTWTAPVDNGGVAIDDYRVQYKKTAESFWWTFPDGASTDTAATLVLLENETSYDFRVRAHNSVGWGPCVRHHHHHPGNPGDRAGELRRTWRRRGRPSPRVTLTWDPPADDGGSAILNYAMHYRTGGGAWTLVDPAVSGRDPRPGQWDRATSSKSRQSTPSEPAPGPPAPTPPTASRGSLRTCGHRGQRAGDPHLGVPPLTAERRSPATPTTTAPTAGALVDDCHHGGLRSDRVLANGHTVRLPGAGRNAGGSGEWSDHVSATPRDGAGSADAHLGDPRMTSRSPWCGPPRRPTAGTADRLTMPGAVLHERLRERGVLGELGHLGRPVADRDQPHQRDSSYQFRVLAPQHRRTGAPSDILSATPTNPAVPPGAPTNLAATPRGTGRSPDLAGPRWTTAAPRSPTTWWTIATAKTWTMRGTAIAGAAIRPSPMGPRRPNLYATLTGLDNGDRYGFRVRAVNSAGTGRLVGRPSPATPSAPLARDPQ